MPAVWLVKSELARALPAFPLKGIILSIGGVAFGAMGPLAAQFVGFTWLFRRQNRPMDSGQRWLLSVLGVGVLALLVLRDEGGGNQLYLVFESFVAGYILSSLGLSIAWETRPRLPGQFQARRFPGFCVASCTRGSDGGAAAVSSLLQWADDRSHICPVVRRAGADAGRALRCSAKVDRAYSMACPRAGQRSAVDSRSRRPGNHLRCSGLTQAQASVVQGARITPGLFRTLVWIRDRTPTGAVFAVDSPGLNRYYYSAFAERRVFIEAWGYAQRSRDLIWRSVSARR